MAKKASQTKVFQLAKALGVTSKDVVAKCQAEDIPGIVNHMSPVSLGLEATIREWFSDHTQGGSTAVETAAPVDVKKARAKAKRKTKADEADTDDAAQADASSEAGVEEEVAEAPVAEPPKKAAKAASAGAKVKAAPTADSEDDGSAPVADASPENKEDVAVAVQAPAKPAKPTPAKPAPVMNVPVRPNVITPAGPMLQQPTKTKLAGPKVIRVENPEDLPTPRARTPSRSSAPIGRAGPRGGRGAGPIDIDMSGGDRARAGGTGAGDGPGSRRNKRRSASASEPGRSGRAAPQGDDRPFNWREQDLLERENRLNRAGGFFKQARRDNLKRSTGGGHRAQSAAQSGGKVKIAEPITVKELSAATGVKAADILKKLFLAGTPVTINSAISTETAIELMLEYDIELEVVEQKSAEQQIEETFQERTLVNEQRRSPVVTILGHVDHGKTSLLDRIRNANVAAGEAGGITQATSAFQVPVRLGEGDRMITFIDTPGHEAFTEMRARGAKVTDIVVLVVAADDGVMPQTVESINHAKAAGVPIVVALNKIDKPEATDNNIQRILGQLAEHELNPSEWGGSTEVVRTSAIKNQGIQDLLEVLDYQAQLLDTKADFGGNAQGTVLEAKMEEGRGAVANILVQHGKLKKGDFVVMGRAYGRIRDIMNDRGQRIEEAGPSMPVAVSGINAVPDAGDKFYVVKSLRDAEAAAAERIDRDRDRDLATAKITLDNIFQHLADSQKKELPLVLKADVQGSLETIKATLSKITNDEITVSIKHAGIGGVNESDIALAEAAGAIILGFNVTATAKARKMAEAKRVDIRFYDVIYDIIDDVKRAAEGLLEPELKLEVLGHAEVREVFRISKVGMIAGCYVTDGVIERNAQIRVTRDGVVIEKDRRLSQLKRFKDDAKEVRAGQECGMNIDGYDDIKVGDVLECYKTLEVRRKL
ncbi:MAG TPA: translation initiation factor IF-2 [Phycisphaerales bacterium]|nr:translation initiation factor IF-2 [Phycisphaerales bacterium]HRQ76807.1 translation initiation factor IF-2 [Phycisphaerales bacterium]